MGETIIERADALKKVMQEAIAETEQQGGMRAVFPIVFVLLRRRG